MGVESTRVRHRTQPGRAGTPKTTIPKNVLAASQEYQDRVLVSWSPVISYPCLEAMYDLVTYQEEAAGLWLGQLD